MKDTKKFFTFLFFLLFFIAVTFITTGCYHPIGGLLSDNTGNYIKAEPLRYLYRLKDDPFRVGDVKLKYFFEGRAKYIDVNKDEVQFGIIEDPSQSFDPSLVKEVSKQEGYPFNSSIKGSKTVVIFYLDMTTDYPIQVVDPEEFPGWSEGGGTAIPPPNWL